MVACLTRARQSCTGRIGWSCEPLPASFVGNGRPELRQKAMHYRRVAGSVSDEAMAEALLEVAAEYDSLADRLEETEPTPGARDNRGASSVRSTNRWEQIGAVSRRKCWRR